MKKIIYLLTTLVTISVANPLSSFQNTISVEPSSSNGITEKKNYKDLISELKKSPSGEFSMYLAIIYLNGITTPDEYGNTISEDLNKSIKYFEKSINLDYYTSSAILGSLYLFDDRFKYLKDANQKAEFYLKQAVENKVYDATMALSSYYFYNKKDPIKALEFLHLGAKHDISTAQLSLATIYAYGSEDFNITKNVLLGNKFLVKACENKNKSEKVENFCNSDFVIGENHE